MKLNRSEIESLFPNPSKVQSLILGKLLDTYFAQKEQEATHSLALTAVVEEMQRTNRSEGKIAAIKYIRAIWLNRQEMRQQLSFVYGLKGDGNGNLALADAKHFVERFEK